MKAVEELQERWDRAAEGRCCASLMLRRISAFLGVGLSVLCHCAANQVRPIFGLPVSGDEYIECLDLYRRYRYGRFVRRHIMWLDGMEQIESWPEKWRKNEL